jgi:hypothetical protein
MILLASAIGTALVSGQEKSPVATPAPATPASTAKKSEPLATPAAAPEKTPDATPAPSAPAKPKTDDDLLLPGPAAAPEKPASGKPKTDDDLLLEPDTGKMPAKPSGDELLLPGNSDNLLLPKPGSIPEPIPGRGPGIPSPRLPGPSLSAAEDHSKLLIEGKFPSASTCSTCHPTQFRQWSVSQHAYAQLSPVFNTMQATIDKRTSGTNGDFCIRCHTQVGMQIKEPLFISNMDRHATSREGITCIVCHRVKADYGKVSGRTAIAEGDIFEPVYGPRGDAILKKVLSDPDEYQVVTKRGEVGRAIHTGIKKFPALERSNFCGTCHDVNLLNGFRLEEAFSQFKNSPANKRGETCQDCHMGKTPGIKSGYDFGPAAKVGDKTTPPRKLTNHTFAGPDYSIIHPGLFPFNVKAQELATMREWLLFNYKAGWGTDAFEKKVSPNYVFPQRWQAVDDRYDARAILDEQLASLEEANKQRYQVLRRAFQLGELVVQRNDAGGIRFAVKVLNSSDGHAVPTGFDAERADFLQITVTDRMGKVIFKSGDRDANGDVRDAHSSYVANWKIPVDKYLFNLQSKFLVTLPHGGEKEQILPTNKSIDPLPYIRPPTNAAILLGRPTGARKQTLGIPPGGFRWAPYEVEKKQLTGKLPYKVNIKFITQMVPVNLVADISDVGIDYNMSLKKIADEIVTRSQTLWDKTITLPQKPIAINLKPSESEIMARPYKPFLPELVNVKVVAKAEPEKKTKATPEPITQPEKPPELPEGAEKKTSDLLETPEKKVPDSSKTPEKKASDLLETPEKKAPDSSKTPESEKATDLTETPEKKAPAMKKDGDEKPAQEKPSPQ